MRRLAAIMVVVSVVFCGGNRPHAVIVAARNNNAATTPSGPPPDTTPPSPTSAAITACDDILQAQGFAAYYDEPVTYKTQIGYGTKLAHITMGAWSAWSTVAEPNPSAWLNTGRVMGATEYFKFNIIARDTALNEGAMQSAYFQAVAGSCP